MMPDMRGRGIGTSVRRIVEISDEDAYAVRVATLLAPNSKQRVPPLVTVEGLKSPEGPND